MWGLLQAVCTGLFLISLRCGQRTYSIGSAPSDGPQLVSRSSLRSVCGLRVRSARAFDSCQGSGLWVQFGQGGWRYWSNLLSFYWFLCLVILSIPDGISHFHISNFDCGFFVFLFSYKILLVIILKLFC